MYAPMGPYSLSELSSKAGRRDGMSKQNSGDLRKADFPDGTSNGTKLMSTDHSQGGFMAPSKVKNMVVGVIAPDARDSGFPIMAHTGKN